MHHFGEAAVRVELSADMFKIILKNHITGAEVLATGPRRGIFEDAERALTQSDAEALGRELAHFLRRFLA